MGAMKPFRFSLLFVLLAALAWSQDCTQNVRLPDAGGSGVGASFANLAKGCSHWVFEYSSTGVVGVTVQVETAPDAGGVPGVWSVVPSSGVLIGAFPVISDEQGGAVVFDVWAPWIRVNMTAGAGDTSGLKAILYGWRTGPPITRAIVGSLTPGGGFTPGGASIPGTDGLSFPAFIDESRYRVQVGQFYTVSVATGLGISDTADVQFVSADDPVRVHLYMEMDCSAPTTLTLYETPDTSADGGPQAAINRNRNTLTAAGSVLSVGPTVVTPGTSLWSVNCGGGNSPNRVGGINSTVFEWVLLPGNKYLIRRTTGAAASDTVLTVGWYEVP